MLCIGEGGDKGAAYIALSLAVGSGLVHQEGHHPQVAIERSMMQGGVSILVLAHTAGVRAHPERERGREGLFAGSAPLQG